MRMLPQHSEKRRKKIRFTPLSFVAISVVAIAIIGCVTLLAYAMIASAKKKDELAKAYLASHKAAWESQMQKKIYQSQLDYEANLQGKLRARLESEAAQRAEEEQIRKEKAHLEAIWKEQQRAAEEKARLEAEIEERARLSSIINAQELRLANEQAEYISLNLEPIVNLPVKNIMQNPELPNGCEITSLAIVLNYLGYSVDKCILSDDYLPKVDFRDVNNKRVCGDPDQVYCGNPRYKSGGYYCFAQPLVIAGNKYLTEVGSKYRVTDITGSNEKQIISHLNEGRPVVAFTTLSMGDPITYEPSKWIMNDNGDVHIPYINLHCIVLYGYDDQFIYIADPLKGKIQCKRTSFFDSYYKMGSRAVVIM